MSFFRGFWAVVRGLGFLFRHAGTTWAWILGPFFFSLLTMGGCALLAYQVVVVLFMPTLGLSGTWGYLTWAVLVWIGFSFSVILGITLTEGIFYLVGLTSRMMAFQKEKLLARAPAPTQGGFFLMLRLSLLFFLLFPLQMALLLGKPVALVFPILWLPLTAVGICVNSWFLGLWYLSYVFGHEEMGVRKSGSWLWAHFGAFSGLGLALNLLFFNPVAYYLLFPVGITSANQLFLDPQLRPE